jgi:hypothetical protein
MALDIDGQALTARIKAIGALFRYVSIDRLFMKYVCVDSYKKHDYLSKYEFSYAKQEMLGGAEYTFLGFTNAWVVNWKKRVGATSAPVVVGTKFTKSIIKKDRLSLDLFLEITNIFDADYSEQSGIPMPGRWLKSGARLQF